MAKLKPSEFRLLLAFGVIAFLLLNVWGYTVVKRNHDGLIAEQSRLNGRLNTAKIYEGLEQESLNKQSWLLSRVPVYRDQDHMRTHLLKFVEQRALSFGLSPELQPKEPDFGNDFHRSSLQVKVSGSIDVIGEWIFTLQDPEAFRAITSLDLTAKAKDPKTVYAEIVIEQWWDPNSEQRIAEAGGANVPADVRELPAATPEGGVKPPLPPGVSAVPTPPGSAAPVPEPLKGATTGDPQPQTPKEGGEASNEDSRKVMLPPGVKPTETASPPDDDKISVLNESGDDKPQ